MRVLLISHTCQSRVQGQPKALHLAAMPDLEMRVLVPDRWRREGSWVRAQSPDPSGAGLFRIVPVAWPWAGPAQTYLHWYPCLARVVRAFRPHVIDLWEEPWSLVSAQACRLRNRLLPEARIVSETEQNINRTLPFPFERIRAYTLRNSNFAVARNTEAVDVLRAKGYRGPVEVVPNAVDADLFRPLDRDDCRRELGLPPSAFVLGYVGRLVEQKGLDTILEALRFCPADTHVLFAGSGPMKSEILRRVETLGLNGRVRLIQGRDPEQVPPVMNSLDALLLCSRTTQRWKEQFGRVIIEAHACGVPVIGTESGAIPEVIDRAGLLVPEDDPRALAGAITGLHGDPELRDRLGRAGRRQVENRYTWRRVAERMYSIYRRVLDSDAQPGTLPGVAEPAC